MKLSGQVQAQALCPTTDGSQSLSERGANETNTSPYKILIQIVKPEASRTTDSVTVTHVANYQDAKLRMITTD
jgi:hypothetical protein